MLSTTPERRSARRRVPDEEWALVGRLAQAYWPEDILGMYTLARVLRAPPISDYVDPIGRPDPILSPRHADRWNAGRVHYFYRRLKARQELDPIEVISQVYPTRMGAPPAWGGPQVQDGHHRFAAAVLARKRWIQISFDGLESTKEWLDGTKRTPPPELFS
jgi:hypothetical protein